MDSKLLGYTNELQDMVDAIKLNMQSGDSEKTNESIEGSMKLIETMKIHTIRMKERDLLEGPLHFTEDKKYYFQAHKTQLDTWIILNFFLYEPDEDTTADEDAEKGYRYNYVAFDSTQFDTLEAANKVAKGVAEAYNDAKSVAHEEFLERIHKTSDMVQDLLIKSLLQNKKVEINEVL